MTSLSVPVAKVQIALCNAADVLKKHNNCDDVLEKLTPFLNQEQYTAVLSILKDDLRNTNSPFLLKQLAAFSSPQTENRIRAFALENFSVKLVETPELPPELVGSVVGNFKIRQMADLFKPTSKSSNEILLYGLQLLSEVNHEELGRVKKMGINLSEAFGSLKVIKSSIPSLRLTAQDLRLPAQDLIDIARANPELEEIDLSNDTINDDVLIAFAENCPHLRKIILPREFHNVTDVGMIAIANHCPDLTELDFSGCSRITDQSLVALSQNCRLTHLNPNYDVTDAGLAAFAERSPQLLHMHVHCRNGNAVLTALSLHCRNLRSVNLFGNELVTDDGICDLVRGCPLLRSLNVSHCPNLTNASLREIGDHCSGLEHFEIYKNRNITDDGIEHLTEQCHWLSSLNLEDCYFLTDLSLISISQNCEHLRSINVMRTHSHQDYTALSLSEIVIHCQELTEIRCFSLITLGLLFQTIANHRPNLIRHNGYLSVTFRRD